jgi:hypothetical protein
VDMKPRPKAVSLRDLIFEGSSLGRLRGSTIERSSDYTMGLGLTCLTSVISISSVSSVGWG